VSIVDQVATSAVAASGIVGATWAAAKWLRRPRFICGIPPRLDERETKGIDGTRLGHASVATAFRHRADCFAQPFRRPHRKALTPDEERRLLENPMRCRSIRSDNGGHARLPVLIANRGKRIAEYTATITFYAAGGKVHVVDVATETLPVYLYADRPELVRGDVKIADERIVAAYDEYLMDPSLTHWGDVVALTKGSLEASLFELVVVEVQIEPDIDSFFVLYTLDCTDGWTGARTFIQACRVAPERVAPA